MIAYSFRRVLQAVVVMWVVVTVVFLLERLSGNAADVLAGGRATAKELAEITRSLGLDQPLYVQYARFLGQLVHGDLGISYIYHIPVTSLIGTAFPYSAELAVLGFSIAAVLGVALGMVAALRSSTWIDASVKATALVGQSVPTFWLGLLLILLFAVTLRWLPVFGSGGFNNLILPSLTLCATPLAEIARLTRSSTLEVLRADHITFERSKGVSNLTLIRHLMRNAALPVITLLAIELGGLLAGTVVVETLFAWPGLGQLAINSVRVRDYSVIQGIVLFEALIFVFMNLLVDLSYGLLDPRVRLGAVVPRRRRWRNSVVATAIMNLFGNRIRRIAPEPGQSVVEEPPVLVEPDSESDASGIHTDSSTVTTSSFALDSVPSSTIVMGAGLITVIDPELKTEASVSEPDHEPAQRAGAVMTQRQVPPRLPLRFPRRIPHGFPRVSFGVLVLFIAAGVFGPLLAPHNPEHADLALSLTPPGFQAGGTWSYPLGTDVLGRDILSRLLYGARESLLVAATAVLISGAVGLVAGVVAGYIGGRIDALLMRTVDAVLAFPTILLAIVLAGIFGPSAQNVIIVISVAGWASYARVIRSEVLSLKAQDFVTMSRVIGASSYWIIRRHLVPNVVPSLLVLATLQVGAAILTEGALSFIGIGVPPPAPSWGGMLAESQSLLSIAWWLQIFPGVTLAAIVMASNLMGDWLGRRAS
jgi:ABC-type dipeptide/oligopeptide/nickel transport system permease component